VCNVRKKERGRTEGGREERERGKGTTCRLSFLRLFLRPLESIFTLALVGISLSINCWLLLLLLLLLLLREREERK